MASATSFYEFKPETSAGEEFDFASLKGKVVLIVNTASKCGFTPQYKNLEAIWKSIKEKYPEDFVILGFPCNQFGGQEPGSNEEIQNFCSLEQKTTFPIMSKIDVNGDGAHPLYKWLRSQKSGLLGIIGRNDIKWNFEKFLVGRDGEVKGRWSSVTNPQSLEPNIIAELEKTA